MFLTVSIDETLFGYFLEHLGENVNIWFDKSFKVSFSRCRSSATNDKVLRNDGLDKTFIVVEAGAHVLVCIL